MIFYSYRPSDTMPAPALGSLGSGEWGDYGDFYRKELSLAEFRDIMYFHTCRSFTSSSVTLIKDVIT